MSSINNFSVKSKSYNVVYILSSKTVLFHIVMLKIEKNYIYIYHILGPQSLHSTGDTNCMRGISLQIYSKIKSTDFSTVGA